MLIFADEGVTNPSNTTNAAVVEVKMISERAAVLPLLKTLLSEENIGQQHFEAVLNITAI